MGLLERIEKAKNNNCSSFNCNGTAFYISGIIPFEFFIHPRDAAKYLSPLNKNNIPRQGDIVIWRIADWISHSGVIIELYPLCLVHRPKTGQPIKTSVLEQISGLYGPCKIEFYTPQRTFRHFLYSIPNYLRWA